MKEDKFLLWLFIFMLVGIILIVGGCVGYYKWETRTPALKHAYEKKIKQEELEEKKEEEQKALRRSIENQTEKYVIQKKLWNKNKKFDMEIFEDNEFIADILEESFDEEHYLSFDDIQDCEYDFYSGYKINKIQPGLYATKVFIEISFNWQEGIYPRTADFVDDEFEVTFKKVGKHAEIISVK